MDNYQESLPESSHETPSGPICIHCKAQPPLEGYANPLCADCRQAFIRHPIPTWIWLFAGGILLLMGFGFWRMQDFVGHAMHMARAEKAMEQHKYVTATRELEQVLAKFPDRIEANADLMIASAYNHDYDRLKLLYEKLGNEPIEDKELYAGMEAALNYAAAVYQPDSTIWRLYDPKAGDSVSGLQQMVAAIDTTWIEQKTSAYLLVALRLYDLERFDLCEKALEKALTEHPGNFMAESMLASVYRNTGRIDTALKVLKQMLVVNREDVVVLAQISRTLLKGKLDKEAERYAREALKLDSANPSALEAQAMVDFYAGRKAQSLATLEKIRGIETEEGDMTITTRLNDILSGKEKYR